MARTGLIATVSAAILACAIPAAATAAQRGPAPAVTGSIVTLRVQTVARTLPYRGAGTIALLASRRPITGTRTTLPVLASVRDGQGTRWLRVLLPGRPNGRAGWIPARSTTPGVSRWRVTVDTSSRTVTAYHDGSLIRVFRAVVGTAGTPTPTGRFFVEESVRLTADEVGAPYALALSARSTVLQRFAGGPGQIALHGTENVGGVLGTAASHGCVRLSTKAITWLAVRIRPGTRVTIVR